MLSCFWFLVIVCIIQFIFIGTLVVKLDHRIKETNALKVQQSEVLLESLQAKKKLKEAADQCSATKTVQDNSKALVVKVAPAGVAATLLLHAPAWFQRRYTMMIQNTISNIPDDWVVQIFYTATGQSQKGLDLNPGIQRFIKSGKVILTVIPAEVLTIKKKRYELMLEPWIWENMAAENILIFGGNSVICSNSPYHVENFLEPDYIGAPWNAYKGVGGDGSISLRKKSAMVRVLKYELSKYPEEQRDVVYKEWGQDDHFFVSHMLEMNKEILGDTSGSSKNNKKKKPAPGAAATLVGDKTLLGTKLFQLATRNDTLRFAAIGAAYNNEVLVVSGTLPAVPFDERNKFLNLCPEIKMFYPSLHDPNCFGATPDGPKCALTICALKNKTERRGGC